jgi:hypothetical protein
MLNMGRRNREANKFSHELTGKSLPGEVIDNEDPEKKQRVKIRIPQIHDDIKDEDLPWSLPNNIPAGNANGAGSMGPIPQKGTKLFMKFNSDTIYDASYEGAVPVDGAKVEEFSGKEGLGADYPNVTGSVDASGNRSYVNTKKDTKEDTHVSGTKTHTDADGNTVQAINNTNNPNKDKEANNPQGYSIFVAKNYTILVQGQISIGGKGSIELIGQGTVKSSVPITTGVSGNVNMPSATVPSRSRPNVSVSKSSN